MRPSFAGVDHVAFTVTDLDTSQRFYTEVLDFVVVMDVGYGRICMHPRTGFVLTLLAHEGARGGSFSELNTGMDHVGFTAASREELEQWERHFDEHGVAYTPIRDEQFGSHLNFRDPDDIALEFSSSNELMIAAQEALSSGQMTPADIAAFVTENVSPDFVAGDPSGTGN
ncbi:MAG: VOC family protein [Actinomycetota bacterium]|nr:VOC family protein [Actinomycetota bacterium]